MKSPYLLIAAIIILWGLWGFFNKIAIHRIGQQVNLWNTVSIVILILFYLYVSRQLFPFKNDFLGISLSLIAGASSAVATILFFILLGKQPAGYLVAVTALYPLITILLSVLFLHENVSLRQVGGYIFALIALYLLNF